MLRMSNFIDVSEYTDTIGWTAIQPIAYHNIRQIDTMPVRDLKKEGTNGSRSQVTIRFRIRGNKESYPFLNELAGANRYLWNAGLAHLKTQYEETGTSESSYFSLCTWYKDHKEEAEWLKGYPVALTRTGVKEISNAFQQFFKKTRAHPKFKKKGKAKRSFAIDPDYRLSKNGYFRLKRGMRVKLMDWQRVNRYSNPQAKSGRIFEERGKWYMSIVFEVDAVEIITDGKGIGVDRNVGQVADSTGKIWYLTDTSHQVKRVKKLQKRLSRRTRGSQRYGKLLKTIGRHQRELANLRKNDLRHIAKGIRIQSDLILLEDLKTKSMTASAKGTVENPGRNVKQKTGLNRVIRETGWGQLEPDLSERGVVVKVNPAYTSQTCSKCGHVSKENRLTQSKFRCQSCTHQENADVNAAFNIRASGLASLNGCGAYIRPLFAEAQAWKRQSESNHLRN